MSSTRRLARMEAAQGDYRDDDIVEVSDKLEEALSSEPLPEEERAAMASVEKQVTEVLAKDTSGKASTLASTQAKQDLKDEPFLASSSEGEGGEREGYRWPRSKTYTERQVEPESFPEEGESFENEGGYPAPANISFETPPLRQVAFQAEESPLDLSGFKSLRLHQNRSPESVLEVLAPTFSISDHVSGFDSKDEHFGPVDVERQCGVIKDGVPCAQSLTCKSHSMEAKCAVAGRSLPYDQLLAVHQRKFSASDVGLLAHIPNGLVKDSSPNGFGKANINVQAQSELPLTNKHHLSRSPSAESLKSLVDSIFSIASISSASTAPGTDNAFQRVLVLLKSDHILKELYDQLAAKTSAGKFHRNFGTLLKRFAVELEQEAKCWDEQRAAQVIRSRARMVAQRIADSVYPSGHEKWKVQSSTFEQDKAELSEDSDLEEEPDEFAELEKFITNSTAFQKLRENIREFLGLEPSSTDLRFEVGYTLLRELPFAGEDQVDILSEPIFCEQGPSSNVLKWWFLPSFSQKIRDLLLPEPMIPAGLSRVRWKCPCGETLYDDYQELKPGAAKRMEDYLRRSSYKKCAGGSRYLTQRISKAGGSLKGFITSLSKRVQTMKSGEPRELVSTEHRYYSDARTTRTPVHTSGEVFYLLLCHNSGIGAEVVKLRQPDICDINNDHKLFSFLHEEYITLRKRWWTWISLWTLQSIKFVRFELYENELVDVKKLDEVPPLTKDNEYRHGPPNPPELILPLGSNLLMHLFKHPELAGTRRHCLKKVPRKLRSRLAVIGEEGDAIGWGLQFIEGWSKKRLMYMTVLTFGLSSFIVMVLVSILGHNIQNAAAIASFILSTIGIATAQAALHMT